MYELGATYLKLRSALHLTNPMPEVDPAIYNLRFALKLDLGSEVNVVATDASRLVRRFKADWMTQGRRPAGVCGACIIIAARMSNYLRTPQEVAQVVKVSPSTIRRRLLEFAQTKVASKTMAEWRSLTDKELLAGDAGEDPPVVKKARAKAEAIRIEALRKAEEEALVQAEEEQERAGPQRARRKKKRKGKQATTSDDSNGVSIQPLFDGDDSDRDLDELEPIDYVNQMTSVRDNPEEVAAELRRDTQAFRKENRQHLKEPAEVDDRDLEELVSEVGDDGKDDGHGEKTENLAHSDDDSDVLEEKDEVKFDAWHDSKATIDYLGTKYFSEEERLLQLTAGQLRDRVKAWLKDREPREVVKEIEIVEKARRRRERTAKAKVEEEFPDLDDEELEAYYMMREPDVRARARLWLSQNGKWLTENKGKSLLYTSSKLMISFQRGKSGKRLTIKLAGSTHPSLRCVSHPRV